MSIMNTGSFPKDLKPGVRMWFGDAYNQYDTEYDKLLTVKVPGPDSWEEDVQVDGFAIAPEMPEGSAVSYTSTSQGIAPRYRHLDYGLGFVITQNMMDDGKAFKNAKRFSEMLKLSLLRTRETVSANVYNNAFDTTKTMSGGDGKALIVSDHVTRAGSQSNVLATAADLSEAAIEQMVTNIGDAVDGRGQKIMLRSRKLVIPSLSQFHAERILNSTGRVDTPNNDLNAIRSKGVLPEGYVVGHYLTDNDAWFILTDCDNGLNYFNRKDMVIDSDNDHDTNNAKFKAVMRCSVGWSDFRGIFGSPGA